MSSDIPGARDYSDYEDLNNALMCRYCDQEDPRGYLDEHALAFEVAKRLWYQVPDLKTRAEIDEYVTNGFPMTALQTIFDAAEGKVPRSVVDLVEDCDPRFIEVDQDDGGTSKYLREYMREAAWERGIDEDR